MLLGNGTIRHAPCRVTTDSTWEKRLRYLESTGRRHALSPLCPSHPPAMWPFACCPVPFSPCPPVWLDTQRLTGTGLVLWVQICCPRSLLGVTAPTATSALPSSESQRANITGKHPPPVTSREIRRPLWIASAFPHDKPWTCQGLVLSWEKPDHRTLPTSRDVGRPVDTQTGGFPVGCWGPSS